MVYTKHNWREKAGTTGGGGQRETWLNNLETQYDEVVSYCTTTLHDTSYYTEAECTATFFYSGNDGTGSGFVCETLDGYTATQIFGSQVAPATIVLWGASEASIPAGWVLCNGVGYAPDLRTKIPVAAGNTYALWATGGSATVSSTAASVTIATHALTTSEMPAHSHGTIPDYLDSTTEVETANTDTNGVDVEHTSYTTTSGSGTAHGHSGSTVAAGQGTAGNNWPAYRAYCYIMKT